MAVITTSIEIDAPRDVVWAKLADLGSHAEWMTDARSIEFEGEPRSGAGTRMKVHTRVGPLRTNDYLEVTDWEPGRRIGVRHGGLVTGVGHFTLDAMAGGTRVTWRERLSFPLWLGGYLTSLVAAPFLARVWRRNLIGLRDQIERA